MSSFPAECEIGISVGADIVEVERIAQAVAENPGILDTVLTARETAYCMKKRPEYVRLADCFAAKEAVLKAFGPGIGQTVSRTDVEIVSELAGKPHICLYGGVATWAQKQGLVELGVSLSHIGGLAVANAVAVWKNHLEEPHALSFN